MGAVRHLQVSDYFEYLDGIETVKLVHATTRKETARVDLHESVRIAMLGRPCRPLLGPSEAVHFRYAHLCLCLSLFSPPLSPMQMQFGEVSDILTEAIKPEKPENVQFSLEESYVVAVNACVARVDWWRFDWRFQLFIPVRPCSFLFILLPFLSLPLLPPPLQLQHG